VTGDGCGAHGRSDTGAWRREDGCDMCARWDWVPWRAADQEVLAGLICADGCRHRWRDADDDEWYELNKREWRAAGAMLDGLMSRGLGLAALPACAACGAPSGDRAHATYVPAEPDQHSYRRAA
jgi:hypothetical protein